MQHSICCQTAVTMCKLGMQVVGNPVTAVEWFQSPNTWWWKGLFWNSWKDQPFWHRCKLVLFFPVMRLCVPEAVSVYSALTTMVVAFSSHVRILEEGLMNLMKSSMPAHFFFLILFFLNQLACTNSTFKARISVRWLINELRWLLSVPWRVACELISLIRSHTMPEQHCQPTLTSLSQVCMHV